MSLVYSDTSTYKGIVQTYERECGYQLGDISGNTARLKELTADVNLALDDFTAIAIKSSGTWQWDDSNQTDYPIISTDLVLGQRDYSFTTDQDGNLILDVFKVFIADSSGKFTEIDPVDVQTDEKSQVNTSGFTDGQNTGGSPIRYDKTANGIFLDPVPNYNYTSGLKVYINREASYFTYTDTTKKPGVPGIFHRYFALRPAEDYARRNAPNKYPALRAERLQMEVDIEDYFASRVKDEKPALRAAQHDNR